MIQRNPERRMPETCALNSRCNERGQYVELAPRIGCDIYLVTGVSHEDREFPAFEWAFNCQINSRDNAAKIACDGIQIPFLIEWKKDDGNWKAVRTWIETRGASTIAHYSLERVW